MSKFAILLPCIALSGVLLHSGPRVGASLHAVCFLGCGLWLSSVPFFAAGQLPYPGAFAVGGGRSFFGGERFSWEMLLTVNFSLVKLITVNLEEAKLPVKNFYTSSSAMFSSGSYWDVATALSFLFAGSCADSKSLAFEQECERERTRHTAGSFCLGYLCKLVGLGQLGGGKEDAAGLFRAFDLFIVRRFRFHEPEAG